MRRLYPNSRGDTIVEVMLALAVTSLLIVSATVLTNRSLKNTQQAREHSEAQEIARSQLELLGNQLSQALAIGESPPTNASNMCFGVRDDPATTGTDESKQRVNVSDITKLPAACKTAGDVPYGTYTRYEEQACVPDPINGSCVVRRKLTAYVTWDGINGGVDKVSMVEGLY